MTPEHVPALAERRLSIVLAGGGSAGHTSPLLATAAALQRSHPSVTLTAIGTAQGLETRVIPAAGLALELIDRVPRRPGLDLVKLPVRLHRAVHQAREIVRKVRADVVVGYGGYVSLPAYLAARAEKIPIVVHEQNALPGLANRAATRLTRHIAVSFPDTPLRHAEFVGLPVRSEITGLDRAAGRDAAARSFGLDPSRPTVLVSGGSLGARSINQAMGEAKKTLLAQGISILHVLGLKNITEADVDLDDPDTGAAYRPLGYVDAMADAYAAADLMVCRAGAGTVVETAVTALPAIFIPMPHGNGEQAHNPASLIAADAGILLPDSECTGSRLISEITALMDDPDRLTQMGQRAQRLIPADADQRLADKILAVISDAAA